MDRAVLQRPGRRGRAHRTPRRSRRRRCRVPGREIARSRAGRSHGDGSSRSRQAGVAEPRCQLGRADDVGEHHRRENSLRRPVVAEAGHEPRDRGHRRLVRIIVDPGVHTSERGQIHDLRALDARGGVVGRAGLDGSRKEQRRHSNGAEHVADVEFHRRPEGRQCRAGAEAASHVPDEPVAKGVVCRHFGRPFVCQALQVGAIAPAGAHLGQPSAPLLRRGRPRVVGRAGASDAGVDDRDAHASVGIRGGEQQGEAGAGAAAEEHGAIGSGRVHDRPNVVHRRVDRLHLADTVGETRPALVEHQHATEGGEALDVADEQRLLPGREEVARDPPHEDDVGRAIADDLVGDGDVAAARVGDFGRESRAECPLSRQPTSAQSRPASPSSRTTCQDHT